MLREAESEAVAQVTRAFRGTVVRPQRLLPFVALLFVVLGVAARCPQTPGRETGVIQFAGYADSRGWSEPQSLGVNRLFTWAELEPADGQYDWSEFDELLRVAEASGKRLVPRVYTNVGAWAQGTPQWVFDEGAAAYRSDAGDAPIQPVPTDPIFTQKFSEFLAVMGDRYDGNRQIEFFQTNAGMGGFGEMVWGNPESQRPPGWSPQVQIETTRQWIDRWRAAFPRTPLVLMENFVGYGIAEEVTDYAVSRGFYLQANDPTQGAESQAILRAQASRTRIILEVEDAGCRSAEGAAWDEMTDKIFGYGIPLDYLIICGQSFDDAGRVQYAVDRLRRGGN